MSTGNVDARAWTVVLRPDGVVDDVQGGAPIQWVGHPLVDSTNVPEPVRAVAQSVLALDSGRHWLRHERTWAAINGRQRAVDVVVCDAVPMRRSRVIVRDVVMTVLDLFRQQVPDAGVEVHLDYSEGVPLTFWMDGDRITWAISTLVGTALRHIGARLPDARGRVGILVDYAAGKAPAGDEVAVHELVIRVSDNGPGIAPERRRWLFERDPSSGRPTGLALMMVRDVVLAHRGTIDVAEGPQGGTSITLRLPRPAER